jgi:uncharacterized damage-inducible protein DinB
MTAELEPVWKQFAETYAAIREALAALPDERLTWQPGPGANTTALIAQHIARANLRYAHMMEHGEPGPWWDLEEDPGRARLVERLEESERVVRAVFERMNPAALRQPCAEHWRPLGPEVEGPLDALWFALQIVRHSAYHLGQINVYLLLLEGGAEP